jgi:membrane associated rhomboid family serine protease
VTTPSGRPEARHQPAFNVPPMTAALLALNVAIYLVRLLLPEAIDDGLVERLGFVPGRYLTEAALSWSALASPIAYQYLHANFMHLAMNMLALLAFGAGVERRIGRWRLLAFYTLCGLAAALAQFAVDPAGEEVVIGASGAISGLFGAILRFAIARSGFWGIVVVWLVLNVASGSTGVLGAPGPVAWVAHLGGFLCGLAIFPLFDRLGAPARRF